MENNTPQNSNFKKSKICSCTENIISFLLLFLSILQNYYKIFVPSPIPFFSIDIINKIKIIINIIK